MWRKVLLTGVMSVISPGSMLQVMIASLSSLVFLVAHTRAWPFAADNQNRMKLATEVVLMVVFTLTVLRSGAIVQVYSG